MSKAHVDWEAVWREFDAYCNRYGAYRWDRQQKKIMALVKKYTTIL